MPGSPAVLPLMVEFLMVVVVSRSVSEKMPPPSPPLAPAAELASAVLPLMVESVTVRLTSPEAV